MKSSLLREYEEWNTPVVGAYLLWRFSDGYVKNHKEGKSPVVILHFIAFAMLTTPAFSQLISNYLKNLEAYKKKFSDIETKRADVLAGLHAVVRKKMGSTRLAIDVAVATGLLAWDVDTASLCPYRLEKEFRGTRKLSRSVHSVGDKAEILGKWFSALSVASVASYLGVRL